MWALVCEIGLWGWIGAAILFILHSFPSFGEFRARSASRWGGCLLFFYVLWIVGMLKL